MNRKLAQTATVKRRAQHCWQARGAADHRVSPMIPADYLNGARDRPMADVVQLQRILGDSGGSSVPTRMRRPGSKRPSSNVRCLVEWGDKGTA